MVLIVISIILGVVILSLLAIMFVDFIINRLYFQKFQRNEIDKCRQLLEASCGEIKENKILSSLMDRYMILENMIDTVDTFDGMSMFFDELRVLTNDTINMYYEKIKNLNEDEKEECIKCHKKYLKIFDEYKREH